MPKLKFTRLSYQPYTYQPPTLLQSLLLAAGLALLAYLLTLWLNYFITGVEVFFLAAVAVAGYVGGLRTAILTAFSCFFVMDYFLIEPTGVLFNEPGVIIWFVAFLFVAALIGWLQESLRHLSARLMGQMQRLEADSERQRRLIASLSEGLIILRPTGQIDQFNEAAEKLTGWMGKDAIGQPVDPFVPLYTLSSDGQRVPVHVTRPDGRGVIDLPAGTLLETRAHEAVPVAGEILSLGDQGRVIILRDRRAQQQLDRMRASSEQRLRSTLDNLVALVGMVTLDGILIEANRVALHAAGLTPEDVLGLHFADTYWWSHSADEQARLRDAIRRAAQGETVRYDATVRFTKGELATIDFMLAPLHDETGQIIALIPSALEITQRKQAEQRAVQLAQLYEAQHRRLEDIISSIPAMVWEAVGEPGPEQRLVYVSDYIRTMLGYTPEEYMASTDIWTQIVHPDDIPKLLPETRENFKVGQPMMTRWRAITKDGRILHVDSNTVAVQDETGKTIGLRGVIMDFTALRLAEQRNTELLQALAEERQRLKDLLSKVPAVVWEAINPPGAEQRVTYVSDYTTEMLGYTPEEWYTTDNIWTLLTHPDDYESALKAAKANYFDQGRHPVSFRCQTKDGRVIDVETRASIIFDEAGQPIGARGFMTDVTEQRRMQAEIAELAKLVESERRRLDDILQTVPAMVWEGIGDPSSGQRMVYINKFGEELLGYSLAEWATSPEFGIQIIHPDDFDYAMRMAQENFNSGRPKNFEYRFIARSGRVVTVEARSIIIYDDEGRPIGARGIMTDVSERKRIEEELRRSNQELEQFAYIASHDLQEPLRMVTSYLQLLDQRYADCFDADGREFIDYAVDGAQRMKTLISDLLTYSRVQTNRERYLPVDMNRVVTRALINLTAEIQESQAQITTDPLPTVTGSETMLMQLIQNLVSNAIKFRSEAAPVIHIGVESTRSEWVFSVRDNGIGIDPKHSERIFVIFQRLHARTKYAGTGIGLAICKKVVERHNGRIWLDSRKGEGATFYFSLPFHDESRKGGTGDYEHTSDRDSAGRG